MSLRCTDIRGARRVLAAVRDVSERKNADEQIRQGLHLERTLREVDRRIIDGADLPATLGVICRAVHELGYRMCWVGLARADGTVLPTAACGVEEGYLEAVRVRWDDTPEGRGPTGFALRTRQPQVCTDVDEDPRFVVWREEARRRGYRASAALAFLSADDEPLGALNVYREQAGEFPPEELQRLETFARQCAVAVVTARRNEALRSALERLTFHVEHTPLAYVVRDRQRRILEWNPAAETTFGYAASEAVGRTDGELLVAPEAREESDAAWEQLLAATGPSSAMRANRRKDGESLSCEWHDTPLLDAEGKVAGVLSLVNDLTEKERLERQLVAAQRMEAVGTLAGGIAHDFNNLLTGIMGFAELLQLRLAGNPKAAADLGQILKSAERASALTKQLLAFARRQVLEPTHADLSRLVSEFLKFLRKVVGEHIEVRTYLAAGLPPVLADTGKIEQVLMNLCVNARDAMPRGGRLLIETEAVDLDADYERHNPHMRAGRYVVLKVSDTGVGMDEKTRDRVFEPFFTTKGPGKGTGLGLAVSYGIIRQHDGFIHFYSEPGRGTTFKVYLPAVEGAPEERGVAPAGAVRGGHETVLLAEDEEVIRDLVERTLTDLGYRVLSARDGEEAIALFRQHRGGVDLALLDVIMPHLGGKQACQQMHRDEPGLRCSS